MQDKEAKCINPSNLPHIDVVHAKHAANQDLGVCGKQQATTAVMLQQLKSMRTFATVRLLTKDTRGGLLSHFVSALHKIH